MRKEFEFINSLTGIDRLKAVIAALRHPTLGCPWDLEQSHKTLLKYLLEESAEFVEALETLGPDSQETQEELGDVLYQVVLHSSLLEERGLSHFDRIASRCADKVIRRHPHVFDESFERFKNAEEVSRAWEKIKAWAREPNVTEEFPTAPKRSNLEVPTSLSALTRAARMGEKAASLGFDWKDSKDVLDKVSEEFRELLGAWDQETSAQDEWGDLVFALAQLARKRHWDPDALLQAASRKFQTRFDQTVDRVGLARFEQMNLEEKELAWSETKRLTP